MKYLKILLVMVLLNFLITGTAIAGEKPNSTNQNVVYLYIELASSGVLEKNNNQNSYTLTLEGVSPWITYFTLTPKRDTGLLHINDFNKVIIKEIKKSPKGLNSGLVARDLSDMRTLSYTVSLKNPVYNAKDKTVTFIANFLPGTQAEKIPKKICFNHVSLFIDACPSCGGEGT